MNKKEDYQEIYINLDDSGKLTRKKKYRYMQAWYFYQKKKKISL